MTTRPDLPTNTRPTRADHTRYALTVAGVPLLVVVVGLVLTVTAWSRLPDVVASHWGADGTVDGTQTRLAYVVSTALLVLVVSALLGAVGWVMPTDGRRLVAGVVGLLSGFLGTVLYGVLLGQRDLTGPAGATLSPLLFLVGALVGAALAVVAVAANPSRRGRRPAVTVPAGVPRVPVHEGERLAWFGHAASAPWLAGVVLGLGVLGCVVAVAASPWAAVGPALGVVLVLLLTRARVVVDRDGLRVRSAGLLTWVRIAAQDVGYAEVSSLRALPDFGGFGLRFRPDARAFVTRSGSALLVVQRDGTRTYVTVDDPEGAAAALNAVAGVLA